MEIVAKRKDTCAGNQETSAYVHPNLSVAMLKQRLSSFLPPRRAYGK